MYYAEVMELVDLADLESAVLVACEFKSHLRYQQGMGQFGSLPHLERGCCRFKSCYSDSLTGVLDVKDED